MVVIARSPVFATMFKNNFKEAKENFVVIEDVEPETMEAMLEYMYTAKVSKLDEHASELLFAAEKVLRKQNFLNKILILKPRNILMALV